MDRIAFAIKSYLNQTETFIYEPLRNISSFEVIILTEKKKNLERFPHSQIYSISDLPKSQQILEAILGMFGKSKYFKRILKKLEIKLIHACFGFMGTYALQFKKSLNLPLVTSFHGLDLYQYFRSPINKILLKRLFSQGDLFLANCKKMGKDLISAGCPEEKIKVLYGGIDLDKFNFAPKKFESTDQIRILMIGRFIEKKGFAYGIKAFAQSYKKHRNLTLRIIGGGSLETEFRKLIDGLGISSAVVISGMKPHAQIAQELKNSDILMVPSTEAETGDKEGLPNVIKEALATGLPVVSTHHSGIPEIVISGQTGFLVKEKDVPELSLKLNCLIERPDLRIKFGEKGRKLVEEKFDITHQTKKLEKIYEGLIDR